MGKHPKQNSFPHVEIRKEKELIDQQPTSQEETALLQIIQLLFCLILSAWQPVGPSCPLAEAEGCQLTRASWDLLPPLQSPSSQLHVVTGATSATWKGTLQLAQSISLLLSNNPGHPQLPHISGKVGSDFVFPLEDSPGCLAPLQHLTMAGNVLGSRDGSILLHLPTSALGSPGGPDLQLPKPHH